MIEGLFYFKDINKLLIQSSNEIPRIANHGFPCVLKLIEHYALLYSNLNILALRYPVLKLSGNVKMDVVGYSVGHDNNNQEICQHPISIMRVITTK